jgi:hypothetical protein
VTAPAPPDASTDVAVERRRRAPGMYEPIGRRTYLVIASSAMLLLLAA